MSRYIGPRLKVLRALGVSLPGLTRKDVPEARQHPPGQHGARTRRKSEFGVQLIEKQKLRFNYGVNERQLRTLFRESKGTPMPTGDKLLELLERRLDNFVFRAGFAPTLVAARQLVRHRHIALNGRLVNIPSIRVRPGDAIVVKEASRKLPMVVECVEQPSLTRPEWLSFDAAAMRAQVTRVPMADEVPFPLEVQKVVEYYAQRI
jgi:small subunit ribosomal protein S4